MNQTHIHLLINHLPVFGSILGAIVLAYGLMTHSIHTKIAACYLFIISSAGACLAYFTGESAEETVENLPGVAEASIKQHEESALYALIFLVLLGFSSVIALIIILRKSPYTKKTSIALLIFSLISFAFVARTGYLGGQIRHTEITNGNTLPAGINQAEDKD